MIVESTREVNAVTPGGIYLGRKMTFSVDHLRIERVVGRTVWGLFFHHFKRRPPEDTVAAVYCTLRLREIGKLEEVARVIAPLRSCEEHVIGGDVFAYRFQEVADHPGTTAWSMRFYDAAEFVVLTVPRALAPRPMVHGLATP